MQERLCYTTKEVTELTGINRKLLYLYRDEGLLHPTQMGRNYVWERKDLERFLEWSKGLRLTNHETITISRLKKPL